MPRKGTMKEYTIDSHYLNEKMTLTVYLPEAYTPLYKYHICIVQDGNDYFQLGRLATVSDALHEDDLIEDTIFVGIHYQDKFDRRKKYHPNGEQNPAYTQFLIREVVPFLDDVFPTYYMGQSRTLLGDSLAGTLALMTALRYPNTFSNVIMQSPLVNQTVMEAVETSDNLGSLDIYHTIGTDETVVHTTNDTKEDFLSPNRQLHQVLNEHLTNYVYHELDGPHTWKPWQHDLKRALTTILSST